MATRIQVRRGTTSEWNTADPILNEGEIGYNSTLGQIKVGDGSSLWSELDYIVSSSSLDTSLGSYIPDSEKSAVNGVAELDASKNILAPAGIIFEGTADAHETTLVVTDPTADRTITFPNATGTVVLNTDLSSYATLANPTFTGTVNAADLTLSGNLTVNGTTTTVNSTTVNIQNAFVFEGTTADAFETTLTVTDPTADRTITLPDDTGTVQLRVTDVSDTEIGYLNGVTSAIQTQIDSKSPTAGNTSLVTLGTVTTGTWSADTIAINKGGTGQTTAMAAATALLPSQTSNSGKYLTNDGAGTLSWATVSGYLAPTLGSTSIASGATVTTIAGLTLSNATLSGSLTAGGGTGTSGQVLQSTGSGVQWSTPAAGAAFSEFMLIGA
jgi:hypothetical protein